MKVEYSAIEWREVVGYEGKYKVSEFGVVFSLRRNKVLKTCFSSGYPSLKLSDGKTITRIDIHTIVAAAFIGERPKGYCVNHIDGVKTNNHYSNLEYCTQGQNVKHAFSTGLMNNKGEANANAKLNNKDISAIKSRLRNKEKGCVLAKEYNVSDKTISDIKLGRKWIHVQ